MNNREERELRAAIELSRLPGVGAKVFRRLLEAAPSPAVALASYVETLGATWTRLGKISRAKAATEGEISLAWEFLRRGAGGAVYFSQPAYPSSLARINEPPPVLFFKGCLPSPSRRLLAVVGAREPAAEALSVTAEVVRHAGEKGWAVVSGGARGIDAAAHWAALEAGVPTWAVLGCGVDRVYPAEHAELFSRMVAAGGGVISELLPGAPPRRGFFPTRNRIIAGLAEAVVVVQAAERSGSLITARCARQADRPLAVWQPPVQADPAWAGNRWLIEEQGVTALQSGDELIGWLAKTEERGER